MEFKITILPPALLPQMNSRHVVYGGARDSKSYQVQLVSLFPMQGSEPESFWLITWSPEHHKNTANQIYLLKRNSIYASLYNLHSAPMCSSWNTSSWHQWHVQPFVPLVNWCKQVHGFIASNCWRTFHFFNLTLYSAICCIHTTNANMQTGFIHFPYLRGKIENLSNSGSNCLFKTAA